LGCRGRHHRHRAPPGWARPRPSSLPRWRQARSLVCIMSPIVRPSRRCDSCCSSPRSGCLPE
jgi:hypothetical protein